MSAISRRLFVFSVLMRFFFGDGGEQHMAAWLTWTSVFVTYGAKPISHQCGLTCH